MGDLLRVGEIGGRVLAVYGRYSPKISLYILIYFIFSIKFRIENWGIFQIGGKG